MAWRILRHRRTAGLLLLLALPTAARAHGGVEITPERWWAAWSWDPVLLLNVGVLGWLYACGLTRNWRRPGARRPVLLGRAAAFAGGLLALLAALVSPLDSLSEQLASAHMVQHMALMLIAAPLLVLGAPGYVLLWGLPFAWRQALNRCRRRLPGWGVLSALSWEAVTVWTVHALALWLWHLPALYQAALRQSVVHDAQHLTFFLAACLFWRVLLDPISRRRADRGAAVLLLFTTSLHMAALGALMALSPRPWYPAYAGLTDAWGLTLLEDQQVAGLIMWMPACSVYAVSAAVLFALWLQEPRGGRRRSLLEVPERAAQARPLH